MSNIKKVFEKGKAFIAFITCGDPDLETTAVRLVVVQTLMWDKSCIRTKIDG